MVRWSKLVIVFLASAFVLTGCTSTSQNFLGGEKTLASNSDLKAYSIEKNHGVVVYKDNGVYNSTGIGRSFQVNDIEDIDFELDYPEDPIGY